MVDTVTEQQTDAYSRRDATAIAVFGTWAIVGLFIDGWAHNVNKPESFFTPWHGILYSGVAAAVAWFALDTIRNPRGASVQPDDRLMTIGLVVFIVAAVGDGFWHEIFGVEEDLEALLSPTHLGLMVGGVLMLTGPVRFLWSDPETPTSLRSIAPLSVGLGLATALVSFFFMYVSAFRVRRLSAGDPALGFDLDEAWQVTGVISVLVTTVFLLVPALVLVKRWPRLPRGAIALAVAPTTLLMPVLDGFDLMGTAAPIVGAALVLDLLLTGAEVDRRRVRAVAMVVPFVLWPVWFGVLQAQDRLAWPADLWSGSVVLAVMVGLGLSVLTHPPAAFAPAEDSLPT